MQRKCNVPHNFVRLDTMSREREGKNAGTIGTEVSRVVD